MAIPTPSNSIQEQRAKIDFDIDQLNYFLEGSEENAKLSQELMLQVERDPVLKVDSNYYELTKAEHRLITARKIGKLATYMEKDLPDHNLFQKRLLFVGLIDPQLGTRLGVHLGLFLSAIRGNGTDAQFNYWCFERNAIQMKDIYGCFAMTELAHGSNVAGLETTLTYDEKRREFTINTPHIGATKWWIGGAAHSLNHAVVYLRLIVKGKDYGVKTFIVPLRDFNHDLYPGISIGDIGAKMGRDGIDNGWIQFTNVKIPKEYMLTKYTRIEDDTGEVVTPPLEQLSYGALLNGRVTMVEESFRTGARVLTIALRYAVGRRQFGKLHNENQLISYPLHQSRLIPLLLYVYALLSGSLRLRKDHDETILNLEKLAKTQDLRTIGRAIESLKNVFGSSAAMKSTFTWQTLNLIDECRQSCGGHGYSSYSGFGKQYSDWVVQCTWEGDNNVLAMNAGRIVIQALQKVLKGKQVKGDLLFLNELSQYKGSKSYSNIDDLDALLDLFKLVLVRQALSVDEQLKLKNNNWDLFGVEKVVLSKLFAAFYSLESFITSLKSPLTLQGNVKPVLIQLARVYALSQIQKFSGTFLQFDVITSEILMKINDELKELYGDLQHKVIGLSDAFKLSDFFINSPLGSYNGDIYNNYFGIVKLHNDPSIDKPSYYPEFLLTLNREYLTVRERDEKNPLVLKKLSSSKF